MCYDESMETETLEIRDMLYIIEPCDGMIDLYRNDADGTQWFIGTYATVDEARNIAQLDSNDPGRD